MIPWVPAEADNAPHSPFLSQGPPPNPKVPFILDNNARKLTLYLSSDKCSYLSGSQNLTRCMFSTRGLSRRTDAIISWWNIFTCRSHGSLEILHATPHTSLPATYHSPCLFFRTPLYLLPSFPLCSCQSPSFIFVPNNAHGELFCLFPNRGYELSRLYASDQSLQPRRRKMSALFDHCHLVSMRIVHAVQSRDGESGGDLSRSSFDGAFR